MKKLLIALVLITLVGCSSNGGGASGTFTGTGTGMGEITATVTLENGKITAVEFVGESESAGISDPAFDKMPERFVEAGNADVDTVSGATVTSQGMIDAVKNAIESAK